MMEHKKHLRPWRKSRYKFKGKVSSGPRLHEENQEDRYRLIRLFDNDTVIREQILFLLLNGKFNPQDVRYRLEYADIRLDKLWNVVMICLIDEYERFRKRNCDHSCNQLVDHLKNLFEHLTDCLGTGYCVGLVEGNGIAVLINGDKTALCKENLEKLATEAQEYMENQYFLKISVGFGTLSTDPGNVHTAYQEAYAAAKYRFLYGTRSIQFYNELQSFYCSKHYVIPRDIESAINMAVKLGQKEPAMDAVEQVLSELVAQEIALEAAQLACYNLISFIASSIQDLGLPVPEYSKNLLDRLMNQPSETMAEFQSDLDLLIDNLCTYVNGARKSKNTELKDQVIEYIHKNYRDPSLCLACIASAFQLSTGHITRFIKDQTGYSLMRYLDKIRMDRAKRLLKETAFTVKSIVDQVGYVDETNFIRKFKKNEGVTPIQYRNLI